MRRTILLLLLWSFLLACNKKAADVIDDKNTNLQWSKNLNSHEMEWEAARKYCSNLKLAGAEDWRLPTKAELETIIIRDLKDKNPDMNADKHRFQNLLRLFTPEQLSAVCDQSAQAFGRSLSEECWLLHCGLRLDRHRLLFLGGIHQAEEGNSVLRAAEIDLKRGTMVNRQPNETELKLMQAKHYVAEVVSEETYLQLAAALTGGLENDPRRAVN
jgi:hypothetical protein